MKAAQSTGRCGSCTHFCNDPAFLEKAMPGLTSMGSAYASVRAEDGVCSRHDRYLSARSSCADFVLASGPAAEQ
jgi:hypothetical protein